MHFVQVTTRELISQETKASLAKALSDAVLTIEVGKSTEGGKAVDWMWFRVLPEDDWAQLEENSAQTTSAAEPCATPRLSPRTCMPGAPSGPHDEPGCYDPVYLQFAQDGVAKRPSSIKTAGVSYMYEGKFLPNSQAPSPRRRSTMSAPTS